MVTAAGIYCMLTVSGTALRVSTGIHRTHDVSNGACVQPHVPVSTRECGLSALPCETPFLSQPCER